MIEKYRNKYRIASHRKPNWDYSSNGMYFLTMVTQGRVCNLGKIVNANGIVTMQLSDFGKMVSAEWFKSFDIRRELILDEFIIMPNHLHAIVIINSPPTEETHGRAPLRAFDRPKKSISSFVAGFKSAVNSTVDDYIDANYLDIPKYNKKNHFFQANYHDHIIRNDVSYQRIKNYIVENPSKWMGDSLFASE